jgi:hypothetical protein
LRRPIVPGIEPDRFGQRARLRQRFDLQQFPF